MTDADYFRRRERQERVQAAQTEDPGIRAIHLELANRYAALDAGSGRDGTLRLELVHDAGVA